MVSVHLCLNKYSSLPIVINLDCCGKTIICSSYGNVISQASEKNREHSAEGAINFQIAFLLAVTVNHMALTENCNKLNRAMSIRRSE